MRRNTRKRRRMKGRSGRPTRGARVRGGGGRGAAVCGGGAEGAGAE